MNIPNCAECKIKLCRESNYDQGKLPAFCPMKIREELVRKAKTMYLNDEKINNLYVTSELVHKYGYAKIDKEPLTVRTRIELLVKFIKELKIKKIGIAFCVALSQEAYVLNKILKNNQLDVYSVGCKCGHMDKSELGAPNKYKIRNPNNFETGCNPILQALLLNENDTELNIVVGLCIGHDLLFSMKSKAPVTTLIVKDKITGHNPAVALYVTDYLEKLLYNL